MKRMIIATIAILTMVVGMCLMVGGAMAEKDYDLSGVWTGTFDNTVADPQPMTWIIHDEVNPDDDTLEIYQTLNPNIEVHWGENSCVFTEVGADELEYESRLLIQGRAKDIIGWSNFPHYLMMTTDPGTLQITNGGNTIEGTVHFWIHFKYLNIVQNIHSDQGTLRLDRVMGPKDDGSGSRDGVMEGYWEGDVDSDNDNGGADLVLPVASQNGNVFQIENAVLSSDPDNPVPQFGDEYSIMMREGEGTQSGVDVDIEIAIDILNYQNDLTIIYVGFHGTLTSPTHMGGTYTMDVDSDLWPWLIPLDRGDFTSDKVVGPRTVSLERDGGHGDWGAQGETLDVTIKGTNTRWTPGRTWVYFGDATKAYAIGIRVTAVNVVSPTEVQATLEIDPGAVPDTRDVFVGTSTCVFPQMPPVAQDLFRVIGF